MGHGDLKIRSKMHSVRLALWYELALGVLAALLTASYLADNLGALEFAIPAAVLQVSAIAFIVVAARQLYTLSRIDFTGPVLAAQRRLGELRRTRARMNRWLLYLAPLLWALLMVVVPHGMLGFDVYAAFGMPWVAANLAFGVLVIARTAMGAALYGSPIRSSSSRYDVPSFFCEPHAVRTTGTPDAGQGCEIGRVKSAMES